MPSFRDSLAASTEHRPGGRCTLGRVLTVLDSDDADALAVALSDPEVSATRIARALRASGHNVGDTSVARHRRGSCKCGTDG